VGEPKVVHFREQAADVAPAGALAGFAGVANEDDKEVQIVACGFDHAVRCRADHIAKGGEKLEENGGGIGLSVGRDGTDCAAGDAVVGSIG
jgi:acylphosphatase